MYKYKKISNNIGEIIIDNTHTNNDKVRWLNVVNASKKEIDYLRVNFDFSLNHLKAAFSNTFSQRPLISEGQDYIFLVLHFPVVRNNRLVAAEIDFFISHGNLITVHNNSLDPLSDFFNLCKKDGDSILAHKFESSVILLYEILNKLLNHCFALIDENSEQLLKFEEKIFDEHVDKKSASRILSLRRNIINFRKIMQNHKNILKKLTELESNVVARGEIKKYYGELVEYSKRIWEILENQKEMVEALYETNESLLSYRMTDIMKTLTIFSVIVFPLTLLAAVFGMNTVNGMPFIDFENGFWYIIAIMMMGSLGMLLFFEKKKWL